MPLTPEQIAGAVGYFTQSGNYAAAQTSKLTTPAAPAAAPKAASGKTVTAAVAPKATNHQQGTFNGTEALNPFDWLANPLLSAAETKFAHDNSTGSKSSSILQDAAVPQGKDQAPKNATQWVLNLLSTGDYASGRFMKQIGQNAADEQKIIAQHPDQGVLQANGGAAGYLGNLFSGVGKDFAAGARGVAEGVGARFNNQAPITPGVDLKTVGGEAAVKNAVKAAGGDAGWQNWSAGAAGTTADIVADPTNLIGGVGLVKGVKAGASATVDALKTGARLDDSLTVGFHAAQSAASAAKEAAAAGKLSAADKAAAAANQVDLKTGLAMDVATRAQAMDVPVTVESVAKDAAVAAKEPAIAPLATPAVDAGVKLDVGKTVLPTDGKGSLALPVTDEHPAMAGIRDLLPQLSTTGRTVDAGKILADARSVATDVAPVAAGKATPELTAAVQTALKAKTVPDVIEHIKNLKATPEGKSLLATPVTVKRYSGDVVMPMSKAIEAAVTRIKTGTGLGVDESNAVNGALKSMSGAGSKGRVAMRTTPTSLESSIVSNVPGVQPGQIDTPALISKLAVAKTQSARQRIVTNLLNLPQKKFESFDQAIKAATSGQVEASAMRSMLKALGINSRATRLDTLISQLTGKGKMAWDEIQKGVPTAQEVLDTHSISAQTAEAAKLVDVPAERAGANAEAVAATQAFEPGSTQAKLFETAMQYGHSDGTLTPTDPAYVETYNKKLYNTMQQPVIAQASKQANNIIDATTGNPITGAVRSAFMYDHVMPVLGAADKALLSEGRVARLVSSDGTNFFGTYHDALENLPRPLAEQVLGGVDYRLTKPGEGYINGLPSQEFKKGLTLFPTSIGFGAKAAREGKNAFAIAQAIIADSGANVFAKSAEGKALINEVAAEMSQPAFVRAMVEIDTTNRALAVANAQKAATDFAAPLLEKVAAGAASGEDRAATIVPAQAAAKAVATMKTADPESLVKDMAGQLVQTDTLQTLGEEGTAFSRSDAAANPDSPKVQMAKQAAQNGKPIRKTKDGVTIPHAIPAKGAVADSQRGAQNLSDFRDNVTDRVNWEAQNLIDEGLYPDTPQGHIDAQVEAEASASWGHDHAQLEDPSIVSQKVGNALGKANEMFNGLAGTGGHEGVGGLKESWVNGATTFKVEYARNNAKWVASLTPWLEHLNGVAPKPEEVTAYIKTLFSALQAHGAAALQEGVDLTDEELGARLLTAQPADAARGLHQVTPALNPDDAMSALQLQHRIDLIAPRSGVGGAYSRMTANPVDVAKQLASWSKDGGLGIDPNADLAAQQSSWHNWQMDQIADPMDTLYRWHAAVMNSSVEPGLAGAASKLFSHTAEGLTRAEAIAKGYRGLDATAARGILQYIPKTDLFHPDLFPQIAATQRILDQVAATPAGNWATVLKMYDRTLGVLKDSMTAPNPSHWVTNILSDGGFNALHGVSPLETIGAVKGIHAAGLLDGNPDDILVPAFNSAFETEAAAAPLRAKAFQPTAVTIKDGAGTRQVNLTWEQFAEAAKRNGADASLHQSADHLDLGENGTGNDLWHRVGRAKWNLAAKGDKVLNRGGAVRDNLARYAQFRSALQSRSFRSLDEAYHYAAGQVHMAHPLPSALSHFEKTTVRRLVTFYSWQRLALGRVLELMLEKPGLVTIPSKYQYEQAQAAGFDPESIGKPFGNDPRIPSYESNGILGPMYAGGYSPLGGTGDLNGGTPHQWGFSISSPVIDALQSAGSSMTLGDPATMLQGGLNAFTGNVSPVLSAPIGFAFNSPPGGIGQAPQKDPAGYFFGFTGAPSRIAKAAGLEPKQITVGGEKVNANTPEQQVGENARQAFNYFTGLKATDYTNDTAAAFAAKEAAAAGKNAPATPITKAQVAQWVLAGYTGAQIKMLQGIK